MIPVKPIDPPGNGSLARYEYTFTKIRLWNMTEYSTVVYLDSDTLALKNFDELFNMGIEFGAALDFAVSGPKNTLNAGVLVIKPNTTTFMDLTEHIKKDFDAGEYDLEKMDQAFLANYWDKRAWTKIPFKYNYNMVISNHQRSEHDWHYKVFPDAKILHFTVQKPMWSKRPFFVRYQNITAYKSLFKEFWKVRDDMMTTYGEFFKACEEIQQEDTFVTRSH